MHGHTDEINAVYIDDTAPILIKGKGVVCNVFNPRIKLYSFSFDAWSILVTYGRLHNMMEI